MAKEVVISADSHLEVKPERWTARVPEQYKSSAPRTVTLPDGGDGFIVDDNAPLPVVFADNRAGRDEKENRPFGLRNDDAAGTGTPEQRVREMDADGLAAEVLFPGNVRGFILWRSIADDDAYRAVVRAYNDWLAEDYCAYAPQRLIGLGVIPSTNVADALAELHHCAELGLKGVMLGSFPTRLSYPSEADDVFYKEALDIGMPLTVHVQMPPALAHPGPTFRYPREDPEVLEKLPRGFMENVARWGMTPALNITQIAMSGVFDRLPDLKFYFAETRLGWVPFWLEQADFWYERHLPWAQELLDFVPMQHLPSEYITEHIYWSIQYEKVALEIAPHLGIDHVMFATDFPHFESEWPNSRPIIDKIYASVPEQMKNKIWSQNVIDYFHLDLTPSPEMP